MGSGRMALADIWAILPGVSFPSRVVRSIMRTARVSASSFDSFLMERVDNVSTRSVAPTSSTLGTDLREAASDDLVTGPVKRTPPGLVAGRDIKGRVVMEAPD